MMKSYNEIVASSKLLEYNEDTFREETWEDSNFMYYCVWMPQNETSLPSSYSYLKKAATTLK